MLGQGQESRLIESEEHTVSGAGDGGSRLPTKIEGSLGPICLLGCSGTNSARPLGKTLWINAFNHEARLPGNRPQGPARPQCSAQVVDQVKKHTQANQTSVSGHVCGKEGNAGLDADQGREREGEREDKQRQGKLG